MPHCIHFGNQISVHERRFFSQSNRRRGVYCRGEFRTSDCAVSFPSLTISFQRINRFRIFSAKCDAEVVDVSLESSERNLEERLNDFRLALGFDEICIAPKLEQFLVIGEEELFELEGEWKFSFDTEGRFWEKYAGEEYSFQCGYDGNDVWQADSYGNCQRSDLDERELTLLSGWIRSGYWLMPSCQEHIEVRLGYESELDRWPNLILLPNEEVSMVIRLKTGKVDSVVISDRVTGLPVKVIYSSYGEYEVWELSNWQSIVEGCNRLFPASLLRVSKTADLTIANLLEVSRIGREEFMQHCHFPASGTVETNYGIKRDVIFDKAASPHLEVISAENGHILVKPLVNGKFEGLFILDSGASGFTLSSKLCDKLGLESFGKVNITILEGVVQSQFRRAQSLQLGPLLFKNPIFLEMDMNGLVPDIYEAQVVGVCGYDVFAHSVVEMRPKFDSLAISLFHPACHNLSVSNSISWEPIKLLCNVPHVSARVELRRPTQQKRESREIFLMVDCGAGGSEIIVLPKPGTDPFFANLPVLGLGQARGAGSSPDAETQPEKWMQIRVSLLEKVRIGGCEFRKVSGAFLPASPSGGLALSDWVTGFLCMDLLRKCSLVVFDYSRKRMLMVQPREGWGAPAFHLNDD